MTKPHAAARRQSQTRAPNSETSQTQIMLFDPDVLYRRVAGLADNGSVESGAATHAASHAGLISVIQEQPTDDLDDGERRRREWHMKMLRHPSGANRSLITPSRGMIERLTRLRTTAPHFVDVIDWIARAMRLAIMTTTPLRLPPCLLLGPPGIGKTWLLRQLAEVLGSPPLFIAMNTLTDRGSVLTGLSPVWKSSGPGKIARQLVEGTTASPIVLLDEIDKVSPLNPAETPIECLHTLLEPENSRAFVDEFLDVPIDASHVFWFASANYLSALPPSILDRFVVFPIEIGDTHRRHIAREIFTTANADFAYRFSLAKQDLIETALDLSPRRATRLWPMAFGFAADAGRDFVTLSDIRAAKALLDQSGAPSGPIGFITPARAFC